MPLTETTEEYNPSIALALIDDRIVQIVAERSGIKDTELLSDLLHDIAERDAAHDPLAFGFSIEAILREIHRLTQTGRIIGVDCQIGDTGYTYLLPANAHVVMTVPENRTRH